MLDDSPDLVQFSPVEVRVLPPTRSSIRRGGDSTRVQPNLQSVIDTTELISWAELVVLTTPECTRMPTPQIPGVLVSRPVRVVRPRDLRGLYVNPSSELARLENPGAVQRLARGYSVLVPAKLVGTRGWRPTIEAVALRVAVADYGVDRGCTDRSIRCPSTRRLAPGPGVGLCCHSPAPPSPHNALGPDSFSHAGCGPSRSRTCRYRSRCWI